MRARVVLLATAWMSMFFGAGQLLHRVSATVSLGALMLVAVVGVRVTLAVRARVLRLQSWPRPGEPPYPLGSRRVPLAETGLAPPD